MGRKKRAVKLPYRRSAIPKTRDPGSSSYFPNSFGRVILRSSGDTKLALEILVLSRTIHREFSDSGRHRVCRSSRSAPERRRGIWPCLRGATAQGCSSCTLGEGSHPSSRTCATRSPPRVSSRSPRTATAVHCSDDRRGRGPAATAGGPGAHRGSSWGLGGVPECP
jgi:hypothetical protein